VCNLYIVIIIPNISTDISGDIMDAMDRKKGIRLIILDILANKSMHGYGIAERIAEEYGIKKPSPGIIYPTLSSLLRGGYIEIKGRGERDKKVYGITEKGIQYLDEHGEEVRYAKRMLNNLGEFHRLGGHELMESISLLIKGLDTLTDEEKEEISRILARTSRRIVKILEVKNVE